MKNKKIAIFILLIIISVLNIFSKDYSNKSFTAFFLKNKDDILTVYTSNFKKEKFKYYGIKFPKENKILMREINLFLKKFLYNNYVIIIIIENDDNSITPVIVFDLRIKKYVNTLLLEKGYAMISENCREEDKKAWKKYQDQAIEQKLGMWKE